MSARCNKLVVSSSLVAYLTVLEMELLEHGDSFSVGSF